MNRRDFLHPRGLVRTAGSLLEAVEQLRAPLEKSSSDLPTLLHFSRQAMATTFEVILPFGVPRSHEAAEAALDRIDRIEDCLTVYRESSAISRVNRLAFREAVVVDEMLFELLSLSSRLSQETEGAFDITTGALIKAWGFFRREGRVPAAPERKQVLSRTGMRLLELDAQRRSVRFLQEGLEINLGSIGKGFALDRVADLLHHDFGVSSALVHAGHSSIRALGSAPNDEHGWTIGIRHPWETECRLALVHLRDRALATSAATFQHLEYNGRKLGHILDPRTGWPAETIASATVLAPTAALADALATAFFILGVEKARKYCEEHPAVAALLLPAHADACPVLLGHATADIELLPTVRQV